MYSWVFSTPQPIPPAHPSITQTPIHPPLHYTGLKLMHTWKSHLKLPEIQQAPNLKVSHVHGNKIQCHCYTYMYIIVCSHLLEPSFSMNNFCYIYLVATNYISSWSPSNAGIIKIESTLIQLQTSKIWPPNNFLIHFLLWVILVLTKNAQLLLYISYEQSDLYMFITQRLYL